MTHLHDNDGDNSSFSEPYEDSSLSISPDSSLSGNVSDILEKDLFSLLKATRSISESTSFEESARIIFDCCKESTGATSGYIALLSDDGSENEVLFLDAGGLPCTVDPSLPMPIRGLRAEAYKSKKAVYDNDFSNSSWMKFMPKGHVYLKNVIFSPLVFGTKAIGLIGLANKETDFTIYDKQICESFGDIAASSLRFFKDKRTLEESEERYRNAFEQSAAGMAHLGLKGDFKRVNNCLCMMFALSSEELIGKNFSDLIYSEDAKPSFNENSAKTCNHESIPFGERRFYRADGSVFWANLSSSLVCDSDNNPGYYLLVFVDITKRKHAENALRESEQRLHLILDSVGAGIFAVSPATQRIVYANPRAGEILGYPRDTLIGKKCDSIVCDASNGNCPIIDLGQTHETCEHDMMSADGKHLRVLKSVRKAILDNEECLLETFVDLSSQKKAEESMAALERQLRQSQKMEALGSLAGGIAHDFNNILTAIIGYSELAMEDAEGQDVLLGEIAELQKAGNRARELVKQILTFSRQTEQALQPMTLQPIVKEVMKLLRASIPSSIDINTSISPNCGEVMADATQIHQILMNLCTNAFHAIGGEKGKLSIHLEQIVIQKEKALSTINLHPQSYALLSIEDTGCGMDAHTREHLFEPYFTTKEQGEGTGMGLAVVHSIVESHGGAINVYSELGIGTRFNVYIPICQQKDPASQVDSAHTVSISGTERILFVDDEESIVSVAKEGLKRLGYNVTSFNKPIVALKYFKEASDVFDIVITDLTMPEMSGLELAHNICNVRSDIPIILCSGFSDIPEKSRGKLNIIQKFVNKPVHPYDLGCAIREIFS